MHNDKNVWGVFLCNAILVHIFQSWRACTLYSVFCIIKKEFSILTKIRKQISLDAKAAFAYIDNNNVIFLIQSKQHTNFIANEPFQHWNMSMCDCVSVSLLCQYVNHLNLSHKMNLTDKNECKLRIKYAMHFSID